MNVEIVADRIERFEEIANSYVEAYNASFRSEADKLTEEEKSDIKYIYVAIQKAINDLQAKIDIEIDHYAQVSNYKISIYGIRHYDVIDIVQSLTNSGFPVFGIEAHLSTSKLNENKTWYSVLLYIWV